MDPSTMADIQRGLHKLAIHDPQPAPILYHYTTQAGLLGIVGIKAIWATSIHYLNDHAELRYAMSLVKERIQKGIDVGGSDKKYLSMLEEAVGVEKNCFVACFSEARDQLSQWRAYCHGGNGFCIGFLTQNLFSANPETFSLVRCVYDRSVQIELIDDLLAGTLSILKGVESVLPNSPLLTQFSSKLVRLASAIKHPAFSEEAEWRLVSEQVPLWDSRVLFREGRSILLPYISLMVSKSDETLKLSEILIGPTPYSKLSLESVVGLTARVECPLINFSMVPYRSW